MQVINPSDLDKFDFNPLDATKIWPETVAKLQKVGRMTLNRVPDNFFESTEQSAFSPGNLVPGIEASEDKLLQGRLFSYFDTQRHRIGPNFQQLAVNRSVSPRNNYNQGGAMSMRATSADVNYQPSTRDQVTFVETPVDKSSTLKISGATLQRAIAKQNNFAQAGDAYLAMSEKDRSDLIENLAGDLKQVTSQAIKTKMVSHFYRANSEYGARIAKAVGVPMTDVQTASKQ